MVTGGLRAFPPSLRYLHGISSMQKAGTVYAIHVSMIECIRMIQTLANASVHSIVSHGEEPQERVQNFWVLRSTCESLEDRGSMQPYIQRICQYRGLKHVQHDRPSTHALHMHGLPVRTPAAAEEEDDSDGHVAAQWFVCRFSARVLACGCVLCVLCGARVRACRVSAKVSASGSWHSMG